MNITRNKPGFTGKTTSNLRYAEGTAPTAENEKHLKNFLNAFKNEMQ